MPDSFEGLLIFAFFALPAYIAVMIYKAYNPVRYFRETQSPIDQAALYLFISIAINTLSITIISLLWELLRNFVNLPSSFLDALIGLQASALGNFLLLILFAIYLIVVGLCTILLGSLINRYLPLEIPLWMLELNRLKTLEKSRKIIPWVLVHLKNGDKCLGLLREYRWVGDKNNAIELVLEKTLYKPLSTEKRDRVGRILLRSDDVLWLGQFEERGG